MRSRHRLVRSKREKLEPELRCKAYYFISYVFAFGGGMVIARCFVLVLQPFLFIHP